MRCLFYFLFFLIGVSFGFTTISYLQSLSFNLHVVLSLFAIARHPPPPPPLLLRKAQSLPALPLQITTSSDGIVLRDNALDGDDEELFPKAISMVHRVKTLPSDYVPKVAFLFLTKGPMPLAPLWELFFKGHEEFYSIYVHADPLYNESLPLSSVFHGKRIPSKPVQWGKPTMIDAERRLLANAILDFSNERFLLLSETCIPLFNFTTIYNYLINSKVAFVGSFDDPRKIGRGRYNNQMWPTVNISNWRKGSQWFEVNRKLANEIVLDRKFYPIFRDYCHPPCYSDEHYIPTLVNILSPESNSNRTITWVYWSKSGPHPERFIKEDVTVVFLNQIKFGSNCTYNGNATTMCFLFARKFVRNTLQPLLQLASSVLFS